ncbi:MAG: AMP-binding protein [Chloroflexi bacterium]|nr:AMP-binding protein [Chloroflexota bacterium]
MNLVELLRHHAELIPDHVALLDYSSGRAEPLTFAELEAAAQRAATLLVQSGLQPGDVVLVFHPMSAELYIALNAILRLGLAAMFIDPSMGKAHIERCCALVQPKAWLGSPKAYLLWLVSPALRRIGVRFATGWGIPGTVRWQKWRQRPPHAEIVACQTETPALITFTSGSTGLHKVAVRTHGFLQQQQTVLEKTLQLRTTDLVLTTLPIFVLSHLASGISSLIPAGDLRHPGRVKPGPVLAALAKHSVTCLEASPAFLARVVRYGQEQQQPLSTLHQIFTGGAPVFPDLLAATQRVAPQAQVTAVYGSTEAEPIAHIAYIVMSDPDKMRMLNGGGLLTGAPITDIKVAILADRWGSPIGPFDANTFRQACLPVGAIGEIVVSGPHVLTGYLHGQGDLETKFQVAGTTWHRTGDAGYLDAQNRLWLMGRCSARITDQAGIIYPFAVEVAAHQHANVKQAALIAHQHKRLLVLECYQKPTSIELQQLADELAWAHVADIRVFKQLPVDKRHNAKIDYTALHKLIS